MQEHQPYQLNINYGPLFDSHFYIHMDIPLKLNHSLPRSRFLNSVFRRRPISATLPDRPQTMPARSLVGGGGVEGEVFREDRIKVLKWKMEEEGIRCDSWFRGSTPPPFAPSVEECKESKGTFLSSSVKILEEAEARVVGDEGGRLIPA